MEGCISGVIGLYRDLFYHLESISLLDSNNDFDLFCLHYVFIPRINQSLKDWKDAWVKHPLRTEQNLSPEQLWTTGLQAIAGSTCQLAKEIFEDNVNVSS